MNEWTRKSFFTINAYLEHKQSETNNLLRSGPLRAYDIWRHQRAKILRRRKNKLRRTNNAIAAISTAMSRIQHSHAESKWFLISVRMHCHSVLLVYSCAPSIVIELLPLVFANSAQKLIIKLMINGWNPITTSSYRMQCISDERTNKQQNRSEIERRTYIFRIASCVDRPKSL